MSSCMEYHKCGDILTSLQSDKRLFVLNCFLCTDIFSQLDKFCEHLQQDHADWLSELDTETVEQKLKNLPSNVLEIELDQQVVGQSEVEMHLDELSDSLKEKQENENPDELIETQTPQPQKLRKKKFNKKPQLPKLPHLSSSQIEIIVQIYKHHPCLWNPNHVDYRFRTKKSEVLDLMLTEVNLGLNLQLSQQNLREQLHVIQENVKRLKIMPTHHKNNEDLEFYQQAQYLEQFVGPFKCSQCECITETYDKHRQHCITHDASVKAFECAICQLGFTSAQNYTVHLRRHTRNYPFECMQCGEKFATSTDLKIHKRKHTNEKPYCCDQCGKNFRTWTFWNNHVKRHDKNKTYQCLLCTSSFYSNESLMSHCKMKHLNLKDIQCEVCDKLFASRRYLRQHMNIHAEKKRFSCRICDKKFAQSSGLTGHMKTHELVKRNGDAVSGRRERDKGGDSLEQM